MSNKKQKVINEFLKGLDHETECCDEPFIYQVYKDKNGDYGLDSREICFDCLKCH